MKNKIIIIILIILAIGLAVFLGLYFIKQNRSTVDTPPRDDARPVAASQLITDDFSINLPAGWQPTAPAIGTSAMAVNTDEQIDDPAVQKINFKSYFAVSYDTLQGGSMSDYLQTIKNQLQQSIPSVVFTKEQELTINARSAQAIEAELTQQDVYFNILMVVVSGLGEDVWVISFNTTKSSWDGYKETFYNIADSFSLKIE